MNIGCTSPRGGKGLGLFIKPVNAKCARRSEVGARCKGRELKAMCTGQGGRLCSTCSQPSTHIFSPRTLEQFQFRMFSGIGGLIPEELEG